MLEALYFSTCFLLGTVGALLEAPYYVREPVFCWVWQGPLRCRCTRGVAYEFCGVSVVVILHCAGLGYVEGAL